MRNKFVNGGVKMRAREGEKNIKINVRSFLYFRGRLPRRFRIPARVPTMTLAAPEVVVHLDLSASKRQPAWIHRTQVSLIIVKEKYIT